MKISNIQGRAFNFSLNQKNIQKGWYLIVIDDGKEYLVRRNRSLTSKAWFGLYQTDFSMKEYIITQQAKGTSGGSLGLAIVIPALVRSLAPFDLWLGPSNLNGDVLQGSFNLLCLLGSLIVAFVFLSWYRKMKLVLFLRKKGTSLKHLGRVRAGTPFLISKKGFGFW